MFQQRLESILVVFQNPRPGRVEAYDDWYTNIHIRDAMRLEGALATQRFIRHPLQPMTDGVPVRPFHWAHTIYEWESAAKSVKGHHERAGTPLMEISGDGDFAGLRDYFFRPRFLSHGWTLDAGFRRGDAVLTVMLRPRPGDEAMLADWFANDYAPALLQLPGMESVGLFSLHEEQSLPNPAPYPWVAIHGLTNAATAIESWTAQLAGHLESRVAGMEASAWEKRIDRLLARDVLDPPAAAAAEERRARAAYADRFMTQEALMAAIAAG